MHTACYAPIICLDDFSNKNIKIKLLKSIFKTLDSLYTETLYKFEWELRKYLKYKK